MPPAAENQAISVVATVRNERAGIRAFVDSLLAQEHAPAEIIIVDGKSTDGTQDILRDYEQAGKIRLLSAECNIAQGRNIGIRYARSELIAVTDAGCIVERLWLKRIAECFAGPQQPDVVAGNYEFDTRTPFEVASVLATDIPHRADGDIARFYPSSRSVAFKKSAWERARGYPEWLYAAEDTLFNIRLRQIGCKFRFAKDAVVRWRPRQTWKALCRQFFNYARGNGRTGIGTAGYVLNLQYHTVVFALLLLAPVWPLALLPALIVFGDHVRRNLWEQASQASIAVGRRSMRWRVLAVMEVVRLAGIAGFIAGRLDRIRDASFARNQTAWMGVSALDRPAARDRVAFGMLALMVGLSALAVQRAGMAAVAAPALVAAFLALKSALNFSRTGPELRAEILRFYILYSMLAIGRLAAWAFLLMLVMSGAGVLVYQAAATALALPQDFASHFIAGSVAIIVVFLLQFLRHLLHIPGSIAASLSYRTSRLYPLWAILSPQRLLGLTVLVLGFAAGGIGLGLVHLGSAGDWSAFAVVAAMTAMYVALAVAALYEPEPEPKRATAGSRKDSRPNIVMIGADTLRADRVEKPQYAAELTPHINSLAAAGTYLASCYVPCARTSPSLASLLTGTWPQKHRIRDNFCAPEEANSDVVSMVRCLRTAGYRTIAVSDWSGADLGKYYFGFEQRDLPEDQWNIKYLIRQGPKDIRLFLSLFTHGRFGKRYLPELYYLAGVPMTSELGRTTRRIISQQAERNEPFLLNVFLSTTHAPFASEYPYYARYLDRRYAGESKFAMARLTEPFEIIRRQQDPRSEFDLDQIIQLYDGCVKRFDDEVAAIVRHLENCGLAGNTIIVIYSDHGMEFFERDTWGQGNSVEMDESSRIPVVIVDPRRPGAGEVKSITRSIDVALTLLELADVAPARDIDGVSLAPLLRGEVAELHLEAYSETGVWFIRPPGMRDDHLGYPDLAELLEVADKRKGTFEIKRRFKNAVIAAKDRMIRKGRWKLVCFPTRNGPVYKLFDVEVDPTCTADISLEQPAIVAQMKASLVRQWVGREQTWERPRLRMRKEIPAAAGVAELLLGKRPSAEQPVGKARNAKSVRAREQAE